MEIHESNHWDVIFSVCMSCYQFIIHLSSKKEKEHTASLDAGQPNTKHKV